MKEIYNFLYEMAPVFILAFMLTTLVLLYRIGSEIKRQTDYWIRDDEIDRMGK